jgi:hypothetical protein
MFAPGSGAASSPLFVEKGLLYAGLSRARVHLIIVATEATMERVCGGAPGLPRRLRGSRRSPSLYMSPYGMGGTTP